MMLAALNGDLDFVNLLIAKDAEVNKKGWAPLHYAATNGHDDVVKVLLDHSAYVDAGSPNGTTPLMMAARGGHVSTVKLLLDNGADLTVKNQIGMTALDFAKTVQRAGRGRRADRAPAADATEVMRAAARVGGGSWAADARRPNVALKASRVSRPPGRAIRALGVPASRRESTGAAAAVWQGSKKCLKIAAPRTLALRKTVQNDDFGAPLGRAVWTRRKTA